MEPVYSFGEWLRLQRETLDLTRPELARCAGCSVSALRKIEADDRRPSRQLAELLAGCLEIPADQHAAFLEAARGRRRVDRLGAPRPTSIPSRAQRMPARPISNLPAPPTPLIGREAELKMLAQLLGDPDCRLLTLVGPGGIGKTRLALEAACLQREAFASNVFFASLAATTSPEFMVPAIAQALGFNFSGSAPPQTQLIRYLRDKRVLLVLDNLEHLLAGVVLLVELLEGAPGLKLLATARVRLELHEEWVLEVQGLPVPAHYEVEGLENYSAITLFMQRAQRVQINFELTAENRPDVVRICHLVEGMPLAIELAAAWVPVLNCREIAAEIERSVDFLTTTMRDVPERQRSLRAVFDHSWELLTEEEQEALCQLSLFRGGFRRKAAQAVAGANLSTLSALVAKSLVRRRASGRYDLHELIRQYAMEQLQVNAQLWAATKERYAAFYLGLAETAEPHLKGANQLEWLDRLEQEHDNFRAVLKWSREDDSTKASGAPLVALQLAGTLSSFWFMRGHLHEGRAWLLELLQRCPGQRTAVYARALEGAGRLTNALGEHDTALALAEESMAIYREVGNRQGLAGALTIRGVALRWQGNVTLGNECLMEALALYRELGDRWGVAQNLHELGKYLADFGGDASGRAMLEESAAILEELGEEYVFTGVLVSLGIVAIGRADYTSARKHFERSLNIAREINYPWPAADALTNLGYVLRLQGEYASARVHFEEAIRVYQEGGNGMWDIDPLCALAENDILQGNLAAAGRRLAEVCARPEISGNQWLQVLAGYLQGILAYYEEDTERAVTLLEETITLAQEGGYKPDLARALVALGRAMHRRDAVREAAALLQEGLWLFLALSHKLGMVTALEGLAELATEDTTRAAKLLATADAAREAIGAPLPPVDHPGRESLFTALRRQLAEEAFAQAWAEGQAISPEQAAASLLAEAYPDGSVTKAPTLASWCEGLEPAEEPVGSGLDGDGSRHGTIH